MNIIQRVRKSIHWLIFIGYSENEGCIAEKFGYTKSYMSQVLSGKVPLSDIFISKITNADKNINKIWIKEGKGSMFKSNPLTFENPLLDQPPSLKDNSAEQTLIAMIKEKDEELKKLYQKLGEQKAQIEYFKKLTEVR